MSPEEEQKFRDRVDALEEDVDMLQKKYLDLVEKLEQKFKNIKDGFGFMEHILNQKEI